MNEFLYSYCLCVLDCVVLYEGFYVCFKTERKRNLLLLFCTIIIFAYLDYIITDVWQVNTWISEVSVKIILFLFVDLNYSGPKLTKIVYFLVLICISCVGAIGIGLVLNVLNKQFVTNNIVISLSLQIFKLISFTIVGKMVKISLIGLDWDSMKQIFKSLLIPSIIMTLFFELYFTMENQVWFNIILFLYMISFIIMFETSIKLVKMTRKAMSNIYIKKILMHTHKKMEEIEKYNNEINEIRHDFKNHVIILRNLIEEEKIEESKKYLSRLNEFFESKEVVVFSGNIYLDAILNYKRDEYREIKFDFQIDGVEEVFIDEVDLCSLIFNLLDNAIQEVIQNKDLEKRINLLIKGKNGDMFIKICNPLSKVKSLKTEKTDDLYHGLGLEIIKKIVLKYDGIIEISQNNDFIVEIMLSKKITT